MRHSMIYIIPVLLLAVLTGCNQKDQKTAPASPCDPFASALNGTFSSPYLDGTWQFNGGLNGTVDIAGIDFNDITCTYSVVDCSIGSVDMDCQGQTTNVIIELFSQDSIKIGPTVYLRTD